jgi:hypothetical protein
MRCLRNRGSNLELAEHILGFDLRACGTIRFSMSGNKTGLNNSQTASPYFPCLNAAALRQHWKILLNWQPCIRESSTKDTVLQPDLGGHVFGGAAGSVSFEDSFRQKLQVTGLHLHQQQITGLVDGDDVYLAMLLERTGTPGPINTMKQGVGGRQPALKLLEDFEFGVLACVSCLVLTPVVGCAGRLSRGTREPKHCAP